MEVVAKSMKRALRYVTHKANLMDEELATALVHAESLVDRKPLTAIASDIGHLESDSSPLSHRPHVNLCDIGMH